jgi:hypothetical protein
MITNQFDLADMGAHSTVNTRTADAQSTSDKQKQAANTSLEPL